MTIETLVKAENLHERIEDAEYLIDNANANGCKGLRVICNGNGFNISKSTLDLIIEVLKREKEKWEKELDAL